MTKKIKIPKPTIGYGYVGTWNSPTNAKNKLGWFVSEFVYDKSDRHNPHITSNPNAKGERFFLCEISIKPLIDKSGRPITKIPK